MDLPRLKALFPVDRHGDIDDLYARFKERHDAGGDIHGFVRYLGRKEVLSSRTMRDLLTLADVAVAALPGDGREFHVLQRERSRYQRLGPLGAGAMGEVLIAADRDLHRTVAVKRIHPQHVDKPSVARRFYTEAQITAQLDHPNIVPVYSFEAGKKGGLSYAMKLVRGETLTEYLAETRRRILEEGRPDEAHALPARLELFLATCAALAYAHSRGVIHRDLKPDNIMVGAFDEVLVMDWGIARASDGPADEVMADLDDDRAHATQAGAILGTPQYMAPEQARGENELLGPASDQYALGLILYELIALGPAIPQGELMATIVRAAEGKKEPMRPIPKRTRVPRDLMAIVDRATAQAPEDRYADVGDLAADVRRFLNNEETTARRDGPLQKASRWIAHHRAKALIIGFVLVLAGLGLGAFFYFRGQSALEHQRIIQEHKKDALLQLAGTVSRRAREVDGAFDRYEELLTGMVYAAELALSEPAPPEQSVWLCNRFSKPGGAPPDLAPSKVYDKPVSVSELCLELAPGVTEEAVASRLPQIQSLSFAFFRSKLESHSRDALDLPRARQEALIRDEGVPAAYTYMGTEDGILATYPGRDTKRSDYDARKRPWYAPAAKKRGPVWIATDSLSDLSGLLLTCAMAVRDPQDHLLAVAAIDLEFVRIIDAFLEQPDITAPVETYFLTRKGEVIVQSSLRDIAGRVKDYEPTPFPHEELLSRFAAEPAGYAFANGGDGRQVVVWDRISTTHWTYVVVGDEAALLGDD